MKGFIISWFFPPNNSSEGLVTFKLLKRSKFQYDVFTQKKHQNWSYGITEHKLTSPNINTLYSNADNYEEWIKEGIDFFMKNHDKYDFIMTRATPKESHLLGLKLKNLFPEKLWIASFGDPLCDSPYERLDPDFFPHSLKYRCLKNTSKKYLFSFKRIINNIIWYKKHLKLVKIQRKAKKIQDLTIKKADIIILNNEYQFKFMFKKYSDKIKQKVVILPHSFESEYYNYDKKETDIITISYLGHLDNIRNARSFLEGLKAAKDEIPNLSKKIKVNFYGNLSDWDKLYIINNELFDVINIKKPVDYLTSLQIMENSNWLLIIDADLSPVIKYNVYFPAKLADYIGANRNIIAITMDLGATSDIIKEIGGLKLNYNYIEIKKTILDIANGKISDLKLKNRKNYENKVVAAQFDEIVLTVINQK